eukprot:gene2936-13770_t
MAILLLILTFVPASARQGHARRANYFQTVSTWNPNTDMTANILDEYIIGETYAIPGPPLEREQLFLHPSEGDYSGISYKLLFSQATGASGEPGMFLVDTRNGQILTQPQLLGKYTVTLLAADAAGEIAVIKAWQFEVVSKPIFGIVENAWAPCDMLSTYHLHTTYAIPGPTTPKAAMYENVAANDYASINYRYDVVLRFIDFGLVEGWIDPWTAAQQQTADSTEVSSSSSTMQYVVGNTYTVDRPSPTVPADLFVNAAAVGEISFKLVFKTFRVSPGWSGTANNIEWELEVNSVFNATVQIGIPKEISGLRSPKSVVFEDGDALPGKFFVDNTGEMLILPTVPGSYSVALVALDSAGQEAVVKEWQLDAAVDDLDLGDSYGPNSQGCGKGGTPVDAVKFDKAFTCECTGDGYFGQNCESQSLSKQISSKTAGGVAGGVFAGTILLVAALFAGKKYSAHREAMKPVDFHQKLAQMMASGEIRRRPSKKPSGSDGSPVLDSQGNRTDAVGEGASSLSIENRSIIKDHVTTSDDLLVPREIRRSDLTLLAEIGKGSFGKVWKGTLKVATGSTLRKRSSLFRISLASSRTQGSNGGDVYTVAAKLVSSDSNSSKVSSDEGREDLLLKKRAANGILITYENKVRIAEQIACGMCHLSDHSFIHRDLAARNVLVSELFSNSPAGAVECKIADFGLSRVARPTLEGAAENDDDDEDDRPDNPDVMRYVLVGKMHMQPAGCPDELYTIMVQCWHQDPAARPTFAYLVEQLERFGFIGHAIVPPAGAIGTGRRVVAAGGANPTHRRALGMGGDVGQMFHDETGGSIESLSRIMLPASNDDASSPYEYVLQHSKIGARAKSAPASVPNAVPCVNAPERSESYSIAQQQQQQRTPSIKVSRASGDDGLIDGTGPLFYGDSNSRGGNNEFNSVSATLESVAGFGSTNSSWNDSTAMDAAADLARRTSVSSVHSISPAIASVIVAESRAVGAGVASYSASSQESTAQGSLSLGEIEPPTRSRDKHIGSTRGNDQHPGSPPTPTAGGAYTDVFGSSFVISAARNDDAVAIGGPGLAGSRLAIGSVSASAVPTVVVESVQLGPPTSPRPRRRTQWNGAR